MKTNNNKKKRVLAFGVFDHIHEGHISFLEQAARLGDELIIAVARDSVVHALKNKIPSQSEEVRQRLLSEVKGVTEVVLGDEELGSWKVIKRINPHIICLGYDQYWLKKDLEKHIERGLLSGMNITVANAYKPEYLHTSFQL